MDFEPQSRPSSSDSTRPHGERPAAEQGLCMPYAALLTLLGKVSAEASRQSLFPLEFMQAFEQESRA
jgi:hypothetical protein